MKKEKNDEGSDDESEDQGDFGSIEMISTKNRKEQRQKHLLNLFCSNNIFDSHNKVKNAFQCLRVDAMSTVQYQQFEICRSNHMLSKGRKQFVKVFKICRPTDKKEKLAFDKFIDQLGFILRFIVKISVEMAITSGGRSNDDFYEVAQEPLSL